MSTYDFGGSSSFGDKKNAPNTTAIIEGVKQEIALANLRKLLGGMSNKCYKKCVTKPGASLDNSERKCIAMCMDRYKEVMNVVSTTFANRSTKEFNMSSSGGNLV